MAKLGRNSLLLEQYDCDLYGKVNIMDIYSRVKNGEDVYILTYDGKDYIEQPIKSIIKNKHDDLLKLSINGNSIECGQKDKILLDNDFTETRYLLPDSMIKRINGELVALDGIPESIYEKSFTIEFYNEVYPIINDVVVK